MKKSEVIKLMKEGTHCIYKDTYTKEDEFEIIVGYFIPKEGLRQGTFSNEIFYWYNADRDIISCSITKPTSFEVVHLTKIEPDNEKPYLYFEGEKYYFGEEYEFSSDMKNWNVSKLEVFDARSKLPLFWEHIRKIDHTAKYKKLLLELKEQAEKDGVNLKELI